ncbi:MAG TPA: DUF1579 family protein [Blastocatellia bacterium]|nr:DUF1579 family protein [Blastocatellia bacterium]
MIGRMIRPGLIVVVLVLASNGVTAQESAQSAANPGSVHQQLNKRIGNYKTSTKFTMQPGGPATESSGTAKITGALGGRFLIEENSGTFMGETTTGLRLMGYNNATKQYEACWTYTMSTAILTMTGTSSDNGKTVTLRGSFADEGGARQTLKVITRTVDADHFVVELIGETPEGKDGPLLTTTYTRIE